MVSLPMNVPGIGEGEVRSVLEGGAHRSDISSAEMLVVDPNTVAVPSSSLKENTPMEVDTATYDNPLLTPNPTIQ